MLKLERKVGKKGQVVIPKPIREKLGIKEGKKVHFYVTDGKLVLERKDGERFLKEFINKVEEKKEEPEEVDWDQEFYRQFKK